MRPPCPWRSHPLPLSRPRGCSELPLMRTSQETPIADSSPQGGKEFHGPHSAVLRKLGREFENPQGARDISSGRLTLAPSLAIAVQRASEHMRLPDPPLQED